MTDSLSYTVSFAWLASAFLAVVLGWVCVVDARRFQIPDAASLGLMLSGLALSFLSPVVTPLAAALGATVGYVAFATLGTAFYHHTGQDGLGLGDAKLLAAAGAWLGLQDLPMLVGVAAIGALTFAVMSGRRKIAFGPWLSGAFWVIWVVRINA